VIESRELCREVAAAAKAACDKLDIPYVFKASFDKANRTSGGSFRGSGMAAAWKRWRRSATSSTCPS
jgi:2-dehydro-3-deoxyphosphooctonate aldolase (KDO 8-P synthase)